MLTPEKNDYYSFGMVLLHLLYPHFVNRDTLHKIIERQYERRPIIDYDAKYGNLNELIAGLTLADVSSRWGEKEVNRWQRGDKVRVEYAHQSDVAPIKLGGAVIRTPSELVRYIEAHGDWYEDLIEDREGYGLFLRWVAEVQDLKQKRIFDNMIKQYRQDSVEFLTQAVIRYFTPDFPIRIDMKQYDLWNAADLESAFHQVLQHIDDIYQITATETIKFYLFQLEFALRQIHALHEPQNQRIATILLANIEEPLGLSTKTGFDDYLCQCYPKIVNRLSLPMVLYHCGHKTAIRATLDVTQDIDRQLKEWGMPLKHEDVFQVAQLCATRGDGAFGVPLLQQLIYKKPEFFERIQNEKRLASQSEVADLLHSIHASTFQRAENVIAESERVLKRIEPVISKVQEMAIKVQGGSESWNTYRHAEDELSRAKEKLRTKNYANLLAIPSITEGISEMSNRIEKKAEGELIVFREKYNEQIKQNLASLGKGILAVAGIGLGVLVVIFLLANIKTIAIIIVVIIIIMGLLNS